MLVRKRHDILVFIVNSNGNNINSCTTLIFWIEHCVDKMKQLFFLDSCVCVCVFLQKKIIIMRFDHPRTSDLFAGVSKTLLSFIYEFDCLGVKIGLIHTNTN